MGFWPLTLGFCYRPWALPDFLPCLLISNPTISLSGLYYHTHLLFFFCFFFSITTIPWARIVKTHIKDKTIWMNKGSCTLNLLSRSFSSHHSITTSAPHNSLLDPKPYLFSISHPSVFETGRHTPCLLKDHPHYWWAKASPPTPRLYSSLSRSHSGL